MILNYFDLNKIVKPIVDGQLDHEFMNDVFPGMLTTAENMVWMISVWLIEAFNEAQAEELPSLRYILESLTLSETLKTTAKWSR
jgi:6-pyruvoyl-tetrahydropterin synthase